MKPWFLLVNRIRKGKTFSPVSLLRNLFFRQKVMFSEPEEWSQRGESLNRSAARVVSFAFLPLLKLWTYTHSSDCVMWIGWTKCRKTIDNNVSFEAGKLSRAEFHAWVKLRDASLIRTMTWTLITNVLSSFSYTISLNLSSGVSTTEKLWLHTMIEMFSARNCWFACNRCVRKYKRQDENPLLWLLWQFSL